MAEQPNPIFAERPNEDRKKLQEIQAENGNGRRWRLYAIVLVILAMALLLAFGRHDECRMLLQPLIILFGGF